MEAHAARGEQVLQRMIETDEGARRLGEVSLVPHSSPIASSGLLFMNTLFDENAACHIALGQAYSTCLKDGDSLTPEQLASRGANSSLIHVDWMIGSNRIDVDGISAAGDSSRSCAPANGSRFLQEVSVSGLDRCNECETGPATVAFTETECVNSPSASKCLPPNRVKQTRASGRN